MARQPLCVAISLDVLITISYERPLIANGDPSALGCPRAFRIALRRAMNAWATAHPFADFLLRQLMGRADVMLFTRRLTEAEFAQICGTFGWNDIVRCPVVAVSQDGDIPYTLQPLVRTPANTSRTIILEAVREAARWADSLKPIVLSVDTTWYGGLIGALRKCLLVWSLRCATRRPTAQVLPMVISNLLGDARVYVPQEIEHTTVAGTAGGVPGLVSLALSHGATLVEDIQLATHIIYAPSAPMDPTPVVLPKPGTSPNIVHPAWLYASVALGMSVPEHLFEPEELDALHIPFAPFNPSPKAHDHLFVIDGSDGIRPRPYSDFAPTTNSTFASDALDTARVMMGICVAHLLVPCSRAPEWISTADLRVVLEDLRIVPPSVKQEKMMKSVAVPVATPPGRYGVFGRILDSRDIDVPPKLSHLPPPMSYPREPRPSANSFVISPDGLQVSSVAESTAKGLTAFHHKQRIEAHVAGNYFKQVGCQTTPLPEMKASSTFSERNSSSGNSASTSTTQLPAAPTSASSNVVAGNRASISIQTVPIVSLDMETQVNFPPPLLLPQEEDTSSPLLLSSENNNKKKDQRKSMNPAAASSSNVVRCTGFTVDKTPAWFEAALMRPDVYGGRFAETLHVSPEEDSESDASLFVTRDPAVATALATASPLLVDGTTITVAVLRKTVVTLDHKEILEGRKAKEKLRDLLLEQQQRPNGAGAHQPASEFHSPKGPPQKTKRDRSTNIDNAASSTELPRGNRGGRKEQQSTPHQGQQRQDLGGNGNSGGVLSNKPSPPTMQSPPPYYAPPPYSSASSSVKQQSPTTLTPSSAPTPPIQVTSPAGIPIASLMQTFIRRDNNPVGVGSPLQPSNAQGAMSSSGVLSVPKHSIDPQRRHQLSASETETLKTLQIDPNRLDNEVDILQLQQHAQRLLEDPNYRKFGLELQAILMKRKHA